MIILQFMGEHPFLSFFLALIAANFVWTPLRLLVRAYRLRLRHKNIALHGWPTPPLDADGDVVHPNRGDA